VVVGAGFGAARVRTGAVATRGAVRWTTSGVGAATLGVMDVRGAATGAARSGASGTGTADSAVRFVEVFAVCEPLELVVFVLDGVSVDGGSSGPGIGVPPAASAAGVVTSAIAHTPTAIDCRLCRREDVRPDNCSLPVEPHGTSADALVSIRAWGAAAGRSGGRWLSI
jgi:hypothetical protein